MTALIPTLGTDRVVLRAPSLEDLPALTAFFASEQSHSVGGPQDALGAHRSLLSGFGHWALYGYGSWHIADRDTDAYLGRTGFLFAPGWEEPELGWAITAETEGKGIAHKATRVARQYGADALGLDAAISYIRPANTRSATLARRLGATLEKTHDDWHGKPCDVWRHPKLATAA